MMWIYLAVLIILVNIFFWMFFKKKDIIYDDLINFYRIFLGYSCISLFSFLGLFYRNDWLIYHIMSLVLGLSLMMMCEVYKAKAQKMDDGYCE